MEPASIETIDDGLPMRSSGSWTYGKLHYLNEYLYRFIVSMRKKRWRAIHYIDLFAGPGRNRLDDGRIVHGSPILALSQPYPFDQYFFGDSDPNAIRTLEQRCKNFVERRICYFPGDANKTVDEVCQHIWDVDRAYIKDKWSSLNLAFLDPEGLELHWETVAKLANFRTDLIIYYPQMGITRNAENSPEVIDRFFGDTKWREIYHRYRQGEISRLHRALLDHYKQKLQAFGYNIEDPLPEPRFNNSKEATLYRLLFVSKHPLGNKFWDEVNRKSPDGQIRLL